MCVNSRVSLALTGMHGKPVSAHWLGPNVRNPFGCWSHRNIRMRPLCLEERGLAKPTVSFEALVLGTRPNVTGRCGLSLSDYVDEIVAGGFPGLRHLHGQALNSQIDGYLQRIVDRDMPEAGFVVRRPATVQAWLRAYAAATSTTASWESLRDAATGGTVNKPAPGAAHDVGVIVDGSEDWRDDLYSDHMILFQIIDRVR